MAKTVLTLKKELTEKYLNAIRDMFSSEEDIMQVASGCLAMPVVDSENNERWVEIKVIIPKGSQGEEFDGYEMANDYAIHCEEQKEKAKAKAEAKAKKIASDKKKRDQSVKD